MLILCGDAQSANKNSGIYQVLLYMWHILADFLLSGIGQVLGEYTGIGYGKCADYI